MVFSHVLARPSEDGKATRRLKHSYSVSGVAQYDLTREWLLGVR